MKKADLIAQIFDGHLLAVVEYRGSTATHFAANAKEERAESIRVQHRIELHGGDQQVITEYLKDDKLKGFNLEKFNAGALPFKKGTKVVWHIGSFAWKERGRAASGTLEALED